MGLSFNEAVFQVQQEALAVGLAVSEWLLAQRQTLSVAESCTGGLVSSLLTDMPGSSAYTLANVVTYSNAAKTRLLGVPEALLSQHGAVSGQVAEAMALGASQLMGADWGLSLTGIAGPGGGTAEKPVGLIYIGLSHPKTGLLKSHRVEIAPLKEAETQGRRYFKARFAQAALGGLLAAIQQAEA